MLKLDRAVIDYRPNLHHLNPTHGQTSMPRKLPPHVERWRDRHGRLRLYFQRTRKSKRVPLPGNDSSEFDLAYAQALTGADEPGRTAIRAGTIEPLIVSYKKSEAYLSTRSTTKVGYSSRLEKLRTIHGHRVVDQMTRQRIVDAFLNPYAGKPGAAPIHP